MKIKHYVLGLIFVSIAQQGCASYTPNTTVTVRVVDEQGKPIPGVTMNMGFSDGGGAKGETDAEGRFVVSGSVGSAAFGGTIKKEGYYQSTGILWQGGWTNRRSAEKTEGGYFPIPHRSGAVLLKPPADFTITLKKIIDPIPMFHKRASLNFPIQGEPIGFDMEKGDWIAPHGNGRIADFFLEATRSVRSDDDFESDFKITFPERGDGFVTFEQVIRGTPFTSAMVGPQEAPIADYETSLEREIDHRPGESFLGSSNPDKHYILRVRTEMTEDGEIVEAAYARIEGDFRFSPAVRRDAPSVGFVYFFNADPDPENRSLEYSGENLLAGYDKHGSPE